MAAAGSDWKRCVFAEVGPNAGAVLKFRCAIKQMKSSIVRTEAIVLKNSEETISYSATLYWTDSMTEIEAQGMAKVMTVMLDMERAEPAARIPSQIRFYPNYSDACNPS